MFCAKRYFKCSGSVSRRLIYDKQLFHGLIYNRTKKKQTNNNEINTTVVNVETVSRCRCRGHNYFLYIYLFIWWNRLIETLSAQLAASRNWWDVTVNEHLYVSLWSLAVTRLCFHVLCSRNMFYYGFLYYFVSICTSCYCLSPFCTSPLTFSLPSSLRGNPPHTEPWPASTSASNDPWSFAVVASFQPSKDLKRLVVPPTADPRSSPYLLCWPPSVFRLVSVYSLIRWRCQ